MGQHGAESAPLSHAGISCRVLSEGETQHQDADRFLQKFGSRMLDVARLAATNAYAPYTGMKTGCAVLTAKGTIHAGCTVENVSYPCSLCAIHCAVSAAVSSELGRQSRLEGHIVACVVVDLVLAGENTQTDKGAAVAPEGAKTGAALVKSRALQRLTVPGCCRQWLREVQGPRKDVEILLMRFRDQPDTACAGAAPEDNAQTANKRPRKSLRGLFEHCVSSRVDCLSHVFPSVLGHAPSGDFPGGCWPDFPTLNETRWFRMNADVTMIDDSPVPPFLPGMIRTLSTALRRAYCPYSEFPVGAAVLTDKGVFIGCNVENEVLSLGLCAEQTAIANAVASGAREFIAVVVAFQNFVQCFGRPCGKCRQVIEEASSMSSGRTGSVTVYSCRRVIDGSAELNCDSSIPTRWQCQAVRGVGLLPYAFNSLDVATSAASESSEESLNGSQV
ncbi:cytidine and deoxycytidylate deaminase zinc-binding region domain-containing protein [Toxoplasma gondii TgCatPRC2]|uniref:Cytidine and deoxycytidylate deaminase zinc-binding region domain-containing protein n=4 Tax=Toxoplasma gondii TaxID=5811 RepID=A0A125YN60_TOXGV|nr:cytidine and deoxycytidylate deaminase zinc-binding region domain-containing protein [Toxoplasma gondii ME49]ESS31362.1 cytidine and deoxycytidylate deaminase zinc-binding region domain-containing protein [Toxoplasma gondii VEG]KYK66173.1 cytidine and deoxycytidylate deaminase zinc-binding region domain-containing protein [Toxoplasma gondii TgCatPRC2]PIL95841.1 cytidine and deoxycytidylate deaminase zinc-binding region domain-containing protein [Toxoplasma gondii COUG]EPT30771.1 cytidine and|eukprot:XP_002366602.2 cytidine and deoxycytidylate deaminase zinc-binding region domain-containing protein [Toxoplasma gondii ME49]